MLADANQRSSEVRLHMQEPSLRQDHCQRRRPIAGSSHQWNHLLRPAQLSLGATRACQTLALRWPRALLHGRKLQQRTSQDLSVLNVTDALLVHFCKITQASQNQQHERTPQNTTAARWHQEVSILGMLLTSRCAAEPQQKTLVHRGKA
eukprot:4636130-Amphidinium_carterae.1